MRGQTNPYKLSLQEELYANVLIIIYFNVLHIPLHEFIIDNKI